MISGSIDAGAEVICIFTSKTENKTLKAFKNSRDYVNTANVTVRILILSENMDYVSARSNVYYIQYKYTRNIELANR